MSTLVDEMQISLIPKDHILTVWPEVSGYLREAASYTNGRYELDDVLSLLLDFDYHLWVAFEGIGNIKGAVVTNFVQHPRKKALYLTFCGGVDGHSWKTPMLRTLQRWGKDTGCSMIEALGRSGWQGIFKDEGFKYLAQVFELPIEAGE
jgi:hypothetical protein